MQTPSERVALYRRRQGERLKAATADNERLRRVIRSVLAAVGPLLVGADVAALAEREQAARRSLRLAAMRPGLAEELAVLLNALPASDPPAEGRRATAMAAARAAATSPLRLSAGVVRRLEIPPLVRPRGRPGSPKRRRS